jgi:hypothetical protein
MIQSNRVFTVVVHSRAYSLTSVTGKERLPKAAFWAARSPSAEYPMAAGLPKMVGSALENAVAEAR